LAPWKLRHDELLDAQANLVLHLADMAQNGRPCKVCSRSDIAQIDAALASGGDVEGVSRAFSLPWDSVQRHRANHVKMQAPRSEPKPAPAAIEPVSVTLRSPSDVLGALEATFGEALALLERSKASGDLRTQNSLLNTMVVTLDKLAKSVGLYNDAAVTINIDQRRQTKIVELYDSLPMDVVRRLEAGETTIEAVLESAS
jgi:hypothetical protein